MSDTSITTLFFFGLFNSSSNELNFSVGNFLDDTISINITITNGTSTVTKTSTILNKNIFNDIVTMSGITNITLNYDFNDENRIDTLKVNLSTTKLYLFVDLRMEYQDKILRKKHFYKKRLI
jgi:hypothetical protein